MELELNELTNIRGGATKLGIASVVVSVVTFLIGVVDGYLRPLKCN